MALPDKESSLLVCGDGRGDQLADMAELVGYSWTARVIAESRPHEVEDEGVAILSRVPLHAVAVWPLPPSHPPRHRLEASIEWGGGSLRLLTLHASVSNDGGRDAQIASLAALRSAVFVLGADLNAPPSIVRRLLDERLEDTLDWDDEATWPVNADAWARAWKEKLGEKPGRDPEPRRLDYLLYRGVEVGASGTIALGGREQGASDHCLVWADVR